VFNSWREEATKQRNQRLVTVAVILSLLLHAGLGIGIWLSTRLQEKEETAEPEIPETIDLDLDQFDSALFDPFPQANLRSPSNAKTLGQADHDPGMAETFTPKSRPNVAPSRPGSSGGSRLSVPRQPMPQIGQGVGEASEPEDVAPQHTEIAGLSPVLAPSSGQTGQSPLTPSRRPGGSQGNGGTAGIDWSSPDVGDESAPMEVPTKEYSWAGYLGHIRDKLKAIWVYPQEAAQAGHQGTVSVNITIQENGRIAVNQWRSSGYRELDDEVRRILKSVELNPIPRIAPEKELTVTFHFIYVHGGFVRDIDF